MDFIDLSASRINAIEWSWLREMDYSRTMKEYRA